MSSGAGTMLLSIASASLGVAGATMVYSKNPELLEKASTLLQTNVVAVVNETRGRLNAAFPSAGIGAPADASAATDASISEAVTSAAQATAATAEAAAAPAAAAAAASAAVATAEKSNVLVSVSSSATRAARVVPRSIELTPTAAEAAVAPATALIRAAAAPSALGWWLSRASGLFVITAGAGAVYVYFTNADARARMQPFVEQARSASATAVARGSDAARAATVFTVHWGSVIGAKTLTGARIVSTRLLQVAKTGTLAAGEALRPVWLRIQEEVNTVYLKATNAIVPPALDNPPAADVVASPQRGSRPTAATAEEEEAAPVSSGAADEAQAAPAPSSPTPAAATAPVSGEEKEAAPEDSGAAASAPPAASTNNVIAKKLTFDIAPAAVEAVAAAAVAAEGEEGTDAVVHLPAVERAPTPDAAVEGADYKVSAPTLEESELGEAGEAQ